MITCPESLAVISDIELFDLNDNSHPQDRYYNSQMNIALDIK